jgi:chitin synthase
MNPLELEIYHQIKNVIGVNPTFYEYVFMVDADTTVAPLSLNRLISAYVPNYRADLACSRPSSAWFTTRSFSAFAVKRNWTTRSNPSSP